jgi:type IV pilus assembly protein PilB
MGIEPFLIASTVRTIIGQRLVRRISPDKETYQSDNVEATAIHETIGELLPKNDEERKKVSDDLGYENLPLSGQNAYTLTRGIDTPQTPKGFKGRMGIYEAFEVSTKIQDLILKRATTSEIQRAAQAEGMITMRQDGYLKAISGRTTIQEINRVAAADAN